MINMYRPAFIVKVQLGERLGWVNWITARWADMILPQSQIVAIDNGRHYDRFDFRGCGTSTATNLHDAWDLLTDAQGNLLLMPDRGLETLNPALGHAEDILRHFRATAGSDPDLSEPPAWLFVSRNTPCIMAARRETALAKVSDLFGPIVDTEFGPALASWVEKRDLAKVKA
jgi:hypothetical protein